MCILKTLEADLDDKFYKLIQTNNKNTTIYIVEWMYDDQLDYTKSTLNSLDYLIRQNM